MGNMKTRACHRLLPASGLLRFTLLLVVPVVMFSCSIGGPKVSGFAIGDTRIVSVGDIVTLRMPMDDGGQRQWRVSSYDSAYLGLVERPRIETGSSGKMEVVTRAQARTPGVTSIKLIETTASPGKAPRTVSFRIRIRN